AKRFPYTTLFRSQSANGYGSKASNRCRESEWKERLPRPDPPLLPSIIFPLGPPSCGDQCRAERALGCGRIFPWGQQAGATGEEAAEGRKCEGGAGNGFGSRVVHDTNLRSVGEKKRAHV